MGWEASRFSCSREVTGPTGALEDKPADGRLWPEATADPDKRGPRSSDERAADRHSPRNLDIASASSKNTVTRSMRSASSNLSR